MNLNAFEAVAAEMWQRIPPELKEGVVALSVEAGEVRHPFLAGVFTMGECVTESWPSAYGDGGALRSQLVLYHGSFSALADETTGFEWEEEIWETILHELLHHREAAAGESGLDELDWAVEQNFLRLAGRPFDPDFYRAVPADPDGTIRLESEIFVPVSERATDSLRFPWRDSEYVVQVPESSSALFVEIRNLAGGRLTVVSPAQVGFLRRLLGRGFSVEQLARRALPVALPGMA